MWAQYLKTEDGIAIQSTYDRLIVSLSEYADYDVHIGMVNCLDYERDSIPAGNALAPLMSKRKSYEHEKELRAIIWTLEHGKNGWEEGNKLRDVDGLYVPMNLKKLIECVHLSPTTPRWTRDLISALVKRFNYDFPVLQSRLSEAAFY